jgi:hypothetical protein
LLNSKASEVFQQIAAYPWLWISVRRKRRVLLIQGHRGRQKKDIGYSGRLLSMRRNPSKLEKLSLPSHEIFNRDCSGRQGAFRVEGIKTIHENARRVKK